MSGDTTLRNKMKKSLAFLALGVVFSLPVWGEEARNKSNYAGEISTAVPSGVVSDKIQGELLIEPIYDELVPDKISSFNYFFKAEKIHWNDEDNASLRYLSVRTKEGWAHVSHGQGGVETFDLVPGGYFYYVTNALGSANKVESKITEISATGGVKAELLEKNILKVSVPQDAVGRAMLTFLEVDYNGNNKSSSIYINVVSDLIGFIPLNNGGVAFMKGFSEHISLVSYNYYGDGSDGPIVSHSTFFCQQVLEEGESNYPTLSDMSKIPSPKISTSPETEGCFGQGPDELELEKYKSDKAGEPIKFKVVLTAVPDLSLPLGVFPEAGAGE